MAERGPAEIDTRAEICLVRGQKGARARKLAPAVASMTKETMANFTLGPFASERREQRVLSVA